MAKKPTTSAPKAPAPKTPTRSTAPVAAKAATPAPVSTPVRNSSVPPKAAPAASKVVTHEMISKRAYEIWQSGTGGSEHDNWVRAERELRGA